MTYDERVYEFDVNVTLSPEGETLANLLYEGEITESFAAEFVNQFGEAQVTPTPEPTTKPGNGPKTGDDSPVFLLTGVLLVCAASLTVIVSRRKKK